MRFRPLAYIQLVYYEAKLRWIKAQQAIADRRLREADTELMSTMINAVGGSTMSWALLEWKLDCLIDTLHANGGYQLQSDLPVSLDNKLEYLKGIAKSGIIPTEREVEVQKIRDSFHALKVKRHDTVHGIIIFNPVLGDWTAHRTQIKKDTRISRKTRYTIKDVTDLADKALRLGDQVEAVHNLIRSDMGLEDFKYPGD